MSDLSWLNPTPHAIAVYASRPLSPVATQHSLPSGRYPLLGPDFHRLDRTSLRLAHSFDHLIRAQYKTGRNLIADRLSGLKIDHQLELGRLLDGKIGGLGAAQHFDDQPCPLAEGFSKARAVAHKATFLRHFRPLVHGRKTELGDVLYECAGVDREEWRRQKM